MKGFIGVSACLVGEKCRYDGKDCFNPEVVKFLDGKNVIVFCPELLGGLSVPRSPAEIQDGDGKDVLVGKSRVLNREGRDVTEYFLKAAYNTLELLKQFDVKFVILKQCSPSCGKGKIYDGSFTGKIKKGNGITAQFLIENHISVITEEEL